MRSIVTIKSSLDRANEVLQEYAATLTATSFDPSWWVYVIDNDEPRLIRSAFAKQWKDTESGDTWALVFCEHADPFCVSLDDLDIRVYSFSQEDLEEWE